MRRVCSLRVNRINLFNTPLTPPWTKKVEKILINHNENLTVVKSPSFLLITQQTPFPEKQAGSSMDGCWNVSIKNTCKNVYFYCAEISVSEFLICHCEKLFLFVFCKLSMEKNLYWENHHFLDYHGRVPSLCWRRERRDKNPFLTWLWRTVG